MCICDGSVIIIIIIRYVVCMWILISNEKKWNEMKMKMLN